MFSTVINVNGSVAQEWLMGMTYKLRRHVKEVCGCKWSKHDAGEGP